MHNQLEKYLSQIEKQLSALPAEQRQNELREIRSHLEMMIEDNIAHGCDNEEAVTKALEQFGAARKLGKALEGTHEYSPSQKAKIKFKMLVICALIYSTNFLLYLLTSFGFITHSSTLTSGYCNFTVIIATSVCGWMNESMNHKKLDLYFIKMLPLWCLYLLLLMVSFHLTNFLFLPLLVFVSIAVGARAYRWYAGDRKLFNWR